MPYLLNALYLVLSAWLLPFWLYRMVTTRVYVPGLWSRLVGRPPLLPDNRAVVWCHASSIGEVLLLRPLLTHVVTTQPKFQIALSTYTPDGFQAAKRFFPEAAVFYAPLDMSWSVRRVYGAIRPRLLVLSELELWPNLLLEAKRRGIPVAVVNSRINDADFRFFTRINRLHRPALAAINWWGAQTARDAARISRLLGTLRTKVEVTGSLKFDAAVDHQVAIRADDSRRRLGFTEQDRIFVAGSTHAPEEDILLDAFQTLIKEFPELRLVLVPRISERFPEVARLLRRRGVSFTQRSLFASPIACATPVTLIDTVGELPALWEVADFAFVGGSLVSERGGHNLIEPAALAKPLCFGPNVWNFQDVAAGLLHAHGAREVNSEVDIVTSISDWLRNPAQAKAMGENARSFIQSQQGAANKTIPALVELLSADTSSPHMGAHQAKF